MLVNLFPKKNLNWSTAPAVLTQTILAAKEFLNTELQKAEWTTSQEFLRGLFDNQRAYDTARGMGVGRDTILKFLGGNWKARLGELLAGRDKSASKLKGKCRGSQGGTAIKSLPSGIDKKESHYAQPILKRRVLSIGSGQENRSQRAEPPNNHYFELIIMAARR